MKKKPQNLSGTLLSAYKEFRTEPLFKTIDFWAVCLLLNQSLLEVGAQTPTAFVETESDPRALQVLLFYMVSLDPWDSVSLAHEFDVASG